MSTFVSVGNAHQAFGRLLDAVEKIAPSLPQPVIVQHGHSPFASGSCKAVPFFSMPEFEQHVRNAALFIVQAGGGGVLLGLKSGKVPVIIPRLGDLGECIDNHQVSWGRALASTGRVVLIEDVAKLADASREAIARQTRAAASAEDVPLVSLVHEALRRRD